jgi:hypothetical protein
MNARRYFLAGVLCLGVIGIAALGYWAFRPGAVKPPVDRATAKSLKPDEGGAADAAAMGLEGKTPSAADKSPAHKPGAIAAGASKRNPFDYGRTPKVDPNANPQVKSVVAALKNKNHPERLSPLIAAKPFNAKEYAVHPAAYLEVVEPGRVFQTAQPGKNVPRLTAMSPGLQTVNQGESVVLRVGALPGAPVSFNSFDLGQFENQLTAITVKANEQGVAEAHFLASPGTIEDVHILAGCPTTSGQARFVVNVQMPSSETVQAPGGRPGPQAAGK